MKGKRIRALALFMMTALVLSALAGCGGDTGGGEEKLEYQYFDAESLYNMIGAASEILILDIGSKETYDAGHIPGALSLESGLADTDELKAKLEVMKDAVTRNDMVIIVSDRGGTDAENTVEYYVKELQIPSARFYILEGGRGSWTYEHMTPKTTVPQVYNYKTAEELKALIDESADIMIIDLQLEEDFKEHHIRGAIPTYAFPADKAENQVLLAQNVYDVRDFEGDVIVICPGGVVGAKNGYDFFVSHGIDPEKLHILEGGQVNWPYETLSKN